MLVSDKSQLRRGMLISWEWGDNAAGERGRRTGLKPLGRILTQGDIPGMSQRFALQVEGAPDWKINPVAAIEQGRKMYLVRAVDPPKVLNARQCGKSLPGATYIGRPSEWGNPFVVGIHGDRDKVLDSYINWLHENPDFVLRARQHLCGRDLICWCHPEGCHGDILRDIAMGSDLPEPEVPPQMDLFPT